MRGLARLQQTHVLKIVMTIIAPSWAKGADQCIPRSPTNCAAKPQMLTMVPIVAATYFSSRTRRDVVIRGCALSGKIAKGSKA